MTEKCWLMIIIFFGGAALTFAKRYRNKNREAGDWIVFWTLIFIFGLLVSD
jgi:hypothetical protein